MSPPPTHWIWPGYGIARTGRREVAHSERDRDGREAGEQNIRQDQTNPVCNRLASLRAMRPQPQVHGREHIAELLAQMPSGYNLDDPNRRNRINYEDYKRTIALINGALDSDAHVDPVVVRTFVSDIASEAEKLLARFECLCEQRKL